MLNSLPKTAKDEHFQDLERMLNKKTVTINAITINQGYLSNKILQNNIKPNKFPQPYLSKDPRFVDEFNKLIQKFQFEIQTYIVEYLTKELETTNQAIKTKVKFINQIDTDATKKISCLETIVNNNNIADLTNSTEKLNRKIKETTDGISSTTLPQSKNKRISTTKRPQIHNSITDPHVYTSLPAQQNNRNNFNKQPHQQLQFYPNQQHIQSFYQQSYHNPRQSHTTSNSSHNNRRQHQSN